MTTASLERARVVARMDRDRRALREAVEALRFTARAELGPRALFGRHPLPFLAGALLLGLWLGARD